MVRPRNERGRNGKERKEGGKIEEKGVNIGQNNPTDDASLEIIEVIDGHGCEAETL